MKICLNKKELYLPHIFSNSFTIGCYVYREVAKEVWRIRIYFPTLHNHATEDAFSLYTEIEMSPHFSFPKFEKKKVSFTLNKNPNSLAHIHYRKLSQVFSQFEVSFAKELLILAVPFCSPSTYS